MRNIVLIFCFLLLFYSKCIAQIEETSNDYIDSLRTKISDSVLLDIFCDKDLQFKLGEHWFKKQDINTKCSSFEVSFGPNETIPIYSELEDLDLNKSKKKVLNKLLEFMEYINLRNELPNDMFQYFNYKFFVYDNEDPLIYAEYVIKIYGEKIEIMNKMIKNL